MAVTDTLVCAWGSNSCGQLGTRTFMDKAAPTEIKELEGVGVDSVACGAQHTLFLCRYAVFCCSETILLMYLCHFTCMSDLYSAVSAPHALLPVTGSSNKIL